MRIPRMIGLPPKISGFAVIRLRIDVSIRADLLSTSAQTPTADYPLYRFAPPKAAAAVIWPGAASIHQADDGGVDRGVVGHRGLRATAQASEPGGGAGPAQRRFERQPSIEAGRQHADKGVAGAGCVDRRDH